MRRLDRQYTRIFLALSALVISWPAELIAQSEDAVFQERERVTAIDLLVEFETTTAHELRSSRLLPGKLVAEDFEVLYGGEAQTVVSVQDIETLEVAGGEWQTVIYFDAALSTNRGLRWAATTLADRIEQLTARGTVEVVFADPLPKTLVAATSDSSELHLQLAEIAQFGRGRDELVNLRYQFLSELAEVESGEDPGWGELDADELAGQLAAEEERLVRRQQDALLTWLAQREPAPQASDEASARKLLFLVSNGYDLDPEAFYHDAIVVDELGASEPAEGPTGGRLMASADDLARGLSAYGWITFALTLPPPPLPPEGVRIGKWLFTGARPELMVPDPRFRPHSPADRHTERDRLDAIWMFIGGIGGKYQEQKEPERAEAYLELGRALAVKGDLEEAEEAFRKAFYHFADDPKTADLQTEALIGLGQVLEQQGSQEARRVFELAHQRSPELFIEELGASAAMRDPGAPMETLARATTGWVIRDERRIDKALAGLDLRVRITYQVSGPADGDLHPVVADCRRSDYRVRAPGWARTATPEIVSAAWARLLLASHGAVPVNGDLSLKADLETVDDSGTMELEVDIVPLDSWAEADDGLRISLGFGGRDLVGTVIEHHAAERREFSEESWRTTLRFAWPESVDRHETEWLAVVVDDVEGGRWGAGLIDLYGLD